MVRHRLTKNNPNVAFRVYREHSFFLRSSRPDRADVQLHVGKIHKGGVFDVFYAAGVYL